MKIAAKISWSIMLLLAMLISTYAISYLIFDDFSSSALKLKLQSTPWAMFAHLGGGAIALLTGPFQVSATLRDRFRAFHRNLGRIYLVAVMTSGSAGLYLANFSDGGVIAHVGFAGLSVVWLISGCMAYFRIRQRDIVSHRRWMIRNFSLTLAAITLRVWLPILQGGFGLSFEDAYLMISWLAWVPNLIIAEWYFLRLRSE
jgi:uncharacterized membrane protein